MPKRVNAWEASDGSIHLNEQAALAHEAVVAVKQWVRDRGIGRGGEWSGDMVLAAMLEDAEFLGLLLTKTAELAKARQGGKRLKRTLGEVRDALKEHGSSGALNFLAFIDGECFGLEKCFLDE